MGQNSSVDDCDHKQVKKIDDTGSEITILQTILERRGSTTKIKRNIKSKSRNKVKSVVKISSKTKYNEGNESIAQVIRNSKRSNLLKQQEKYIERVKAMTSKTNTFCDHVSTTSRRLNPSTVFQSEVKLSNLLQNNHLPTTKPSKTVKNWTVKEPIESFFFNIDPLPKNDIPFKKDQKDEQNFEKKGLGTDGIKFLSIKQNNREQINKLFENLQKCDNRFKEIDKSLYLNRKNRLKTLNFFHQNTVTILPMDDIEDGESIITKPNFEAREYNSENQLKILTDQHLCQKNEENEKINRMKKQAAMNDLPYQNDHGFRNLLSELRYKITPHKEDPNELTEPTLLGTSATSSQCSGSTKNHENRHKKVSHQHITEAPKERFRMYSTSEFVQSPKPSSCSKKNYESSGRERTTLTFSSRNPFKQESNQKESAEKKTRQNVQISYCKHENLEDNLLEERPISEATSRTRTPLVYKRYRSINDNSRIYYYMKTPEDKDELNTEDFESQPLPKIPSETKCRKSPKNKRLENKFKANDSDDRKVSWVQDKNSNWHKVEV